MSKMIQLRHVPDELHRTLKARAAFAGMTLSDYLQHELERVAERLPLEELRERLSRLDPVMVRERPVDALRKERDRR